MHGNLNIKFSSLASQDFLSLMATEISLMCLKVLAILRCVESDESISHVHTIFLYYQFIILTGKA